VHDDAVDGVGRRIAAEAVAERGQYGPAGRLVAPLPEVVRRAVGLDDLDPLHEAARLARVRVLGDAHLGDPLRRRVPEPQLVRRRVLVPLRRATLARVSRHSRERGCADRGAQDPPWFVPHQSTDGRPVASTAPYAPP
jgi:hypothetical protein